MIPLRASPVETLQPSIGGTQEYAENQEAETHGDSRENNENAPEVGIPLLKRRKKALVIVPPLENPAMAVMDYAFDFVTNFPLAALKLVSLYRNRGYEVHLLDAFNLGPDIMQRKTFFRRDRVRRLAPCGNYENEGIARPVFRIGLTPDEIRRRLDALPNDVDEVAISSIFTYCWPTSWEMVELSKERFPSARVRLGGIYPSLCPEHARQSGADDVAVGTDGELAAQWIDEITWKHYGNPSMSLKSSYGCNNRCSYCAVRKLEGRARTLERDGLMEQLRAYSVWGLRELHFWDSDLLLDLDQAHALLDLLIALKGGVSLGVPSGFSLAHFDMELALKMKQAGFKDIIMPLETTRMDKIAEFHRRHLFKRFDSGVETALRAGFERRRVNAVIMIGYPGQTEDDVLDDLKAIVERHVLIDIRVYTPIPGTEDFDKYRHLYEGRGLEDLDSFLFPLASPDLPVTFMEEVYKTFNFKLFSKAEILAGRKTHPLFDRLAERFR